MSQTTRKRVHLLYGIAYIAVTVIAGICFILAAQDLYRTGLTTGTQPYTRELIAQAFSRIAIPVYLCLAMTIGGFILYLFLPPEHKKLSPEKNLPLILSRLQAKTDLQQCDNSLQTAIAAQQKARKLHRIISAALLAVCSAIFLVYACNPNRWPATEEISAKLSDVMATSVWVLFACLLLPTGYAIFTAYFSRRSLNKEIELMRQAAAQAPKKAEPAATAPAKLPFTAVARYAILIAAIVLIIVGYSNEGFRGVIAKAAAICLECVGLG